MISPVRRVKAALIGTGQIAAEHLTCLHTVPEAEVVAVADLSRAAAEATAERFGVDRAYTDHAAMLSDVGPEVVHVTTPAPSHERLTRDALESGAHVLLEKPAALSRESLQTLLELATRRNRLLLEDHNYVFDPAIQRIRDLQASGELGEVRHVDVSLALAISGAGSRYGDREVPHFSHTHPAGPILEFVTHLASLCHAIAGPHNRVVTFWRRLAHSTALPHDELMVAVEGDRTTASLRFSANCALDSFVVTVEAERIRARASLFDQRLSLARPWPVPRPLVPLLNDFTDGAGAVRAGLTTLAGKLGSGPGTYAGLWELVRRLYAALGGDGAPPVSSDDVQEVNRLVFDVLDQAPVRDIATT